MRTRHLMLFSALLLVLAISPAGGQEWNLQLVDDAGDAGYYSQICSLSDGTPCLSYKSGNAIRLARWVEQGGESGWVFQQVVTNTYGYNFKMVVDDLDRLHFVYCNSSGATYGVWDPIAGSWLLGPQSTGLTGYYYYLDMIIRTEGVNRVPYVAAASDGYPVKVATRDPGSGTWSNEAICDASHPSTGAASIAVDSAGGRHVSFCELVSGEYNLMYAVKPVGGSWMLQTVDPGGTANVGEYNSILIDGSGGVHIVYYDRTNKDLKYASTVAP